ncbi:DUF559 domain-containing protein [Catenuloplanes atrovinosus]|uniref:DUF559 domain-containing protein n=1 Tax=Catenuloplanes atrovinosus TaxID=137266 RepID=A0AAE3YZC5_9ACTN|nr:DUF559 domain-containing protein [Catenuloplanes atrovinosus]MDR7280896.1 hypothetical protein [Catenuloplanes atrovinosus]
MRQDVGVARLASVPMQLRIRPFRGDRAVSGGLITRRQLQSAAWRRLFPQVYVEDAAFVPDDHRLWCEAAALLLPPGAAISGDSAAFLWGAASPRWNAPVTVTVPRSRRLESGPRLSVTCRTLPAEDVAEFGGLPVTTPLRTAFDLGRQSDRRRAIVALDAFLHHRMVEAGKLEAFARGRARWPGNRRLLERLAEAEPLTESPMETLLRLLITDAGLPRPFAQVEVTTDGGRWLARVDLAYPDLRIAIEYEGDHHRERDTFRRDITRKRTLEAAGWLVLRFTADDVLRRPADTVAMIAETLHRREARQPSASP